MINLEVPGKFRPLLTQAASLADDMFRPISRKYDRAEHEYPTELDLLSAVLDGMADSGALRARVRAGRRRPPRTQHQDPPASAPDATTGRVRPPRTAPTSPRRCPSCRPAAATSA